MLSKENIKKMSEIEFFTLVKEYFYYCKYTGNIVRTKLTPIGTNKGRTGIISQKKAGYILFRFLGRDVYGHRFAYFSHYGVIPENKDIDHINGIKSDNAIGNLREATRSQNMQNRRKAQSSNKSGLLGVTTRCMKNRTVFSATIYIQNKKRVYLGIFDTPEDAHNAYVENKRKYHDFCSI